MNSLSLNVLCRQSGSMNQGGQARARTDTCQHALGESKGHVVDDDFVVGFWVWTQVGSGRGPCGKPAFVSVYLFR